LTALRSSASAGAWFWGVFFIGNLLEVVSKPHLRPNGCVVPQIEILTYYRVRSVFNLRDALPLNLIWGFETTSEMTILDMCGFCNPQRKRHRHENAADIHQRMLQGNSNFFITGIYNGQVRPTTFSFG
jgi:hypothetical protein